MATIPSAAIAKLQSLLKERADIDLSHIELAEILWLALQKEQDLTQAQSSSRQLLESPKNTEKSPFSLIKSPEQKPSPPIQSSERKPSPPIQSSEDKSPEERTVSRHCFISH